MRNLPYISDAVYNEPWAIDRAKMKSIICALENALARKETVEAVAMKANPQSPRPLRVINGIPVIDVMHVISRRGNLMTEVSGFTSVDLLDSQLSEAIALKPKAIIHIFDSPGGAMPGVAEYGSRLFSIRESTPIQMIGFVDGSACSAAYWWGAQMDKLYLTEGSYVGCIGIVSEYVDDSRRMKNEGIDSVTIASSELKATGRGPLTPNQMGAMQDRVDALTTMFHAAIKRGRPGLNLDGIDPARIWIGQQSVDAGLCDGVSTFDAVLAKLAQ